MEEGDATVFGIHDVLSTRYGNTLTGTFISGNKIAFSAYRPVLNGKLDGSTEYTSKDPVYIHLFQEDFIFSDSVLRGLIAESNSTFVALQGLKQKAHLNDYVKISRTYRSIIRACLEKLEEAAKLAGLKGDDTAVKNYKQHISIFYSIECVWHLAEILLLCSTSTNTVVPKLINWIRFHFPNAEREATDLMLKGREASDSEAYWTTLKSLIIQGQIDVTRAILQLHPSAHSTAFKMVDDILKNLPFFNYGFVSIQKFRIQHECWLVQTEHKLTSNILAVEPRLEELVKLVIGDNETWNEHIQESIAWYEYLPGYLLYTNPTCKYFELGDAANAWLNRWKRFRNDQRELIRLDYLLLQLMDNNMISVVYSIKLMPDRQWFATHLIDLLHNAGQLKIISKKERFDFSVIRENLLYEFGSNLMTLNSLWQLGIDYLEHCAGSGRATLEILLAKIPIQSEKQAFKVLNVVKQKKFASVESEICKVLSRRSFDEGRYGNALEWAVRSKDTIFVTSISDFLLKHYARNGQVLCPDVIANIGAKMFISPRLVFLVKYFDFYQFYRKGDFLPAAELLISLLESRITPHYFWTSLIIDTIPLLESKDPKILSKETCAILYHIETELLPLLKRKEKKLSKNPNANLELLKDYRVDNINEVIDLLRLACARNLSRALIIENTIIR